MGDNTRPIIFIIHHFPINDPWERRELIEADNLEQALTKFRKKFPRSDINAIFQQIFTDSPLTKKGRPKSQ